MEKKPSTAPVIAVDGPSASGKGSLARALGRTLGFAVLETGKLYRAVGYAVLQAGGDPGDLATALAAAEALQARIGPDTLADPALESDAAGQAASQASAHPAVRAALFDLQRGFAANPPNGAPGAVLDGRDIGTVICPDALLKLYIDAPVAIRAERRFKELQSKGFSVTYDAVLADMHSRDRRDAERISAPLRPADDAVILDTGALRPEEVLEAALFLVRERFPSA